MNDDIDDLRKQSPRALRARESGGEAGQGETHYLQVADFLAIASAVLGFAEEEICLEEVVELARHALDAPAAERRGPARDREIYPDLAAKAAIMCGRLLTEPPCMEDAGKIAYGCLQTFLLRNGAQWNEDGHRTVLRFNRVVGDPREAKGLMPWLRERVVPPSRPLPRSSGPNLFTPQRDVPAIVYLAGPVEDLAEQPAVSLEAVRGQVERALDTVTEQTNNAVEIRLEHPSARLGADAVSSCTDKEAWEFVSRQLLEGVDALIVVDIAAAGAGFAAASELDLHCQQDGPILYLHSCSTCPSRFLMGRADEVDVEIVEYESFDEIGGIVSAWALDRWQTIRGAAQRRGDRQLQYGPLKRRLETAWKAADRRKREVVSHAAGMKPQAVNRVLTSTAQLSVLPSHRLDALCRELAVPALRTHRQEVRVKAQASPNYGALLAAAEEERWSVETINLLYRDALTTDKPRAFAPRLRYQQKSDWKKRHRELGL